MNPGTRGALALAMTFTLSGGFGGARDATTVRAQQGGDRVVNVSPVPFGDRNALTKDVYNASGIVPLGDSRFLVCDNNLNHALLRLEMTADGRQSAPLTLLPLTGLSKGAVDDIEDLAFVHEGGHSYIFASPSLSVKAGSKKKGTGATVRPSGLIRITVAGDKSYVAEAMPSFRDWMVAHVPALAAAANIAPDQGGLNVEGLAWDPTRHALLFGVRSPAPDQAPIVVPVRLKNIAGHWNASNFEALQPIHLKVEASEGGRGIRGMATLPDAKGFLVVVGNATSADPSIFELYSWDGNETGTVRRLPVTFQSGMKPEGITVGTVGGKLSAVFVDDGGGFQALPLDVLGVGGTSPTE